MKRNYVSALFVLSLALTAAAPVAFAQAATDPAAQTASSPEHRHHHMRDPHKAAMHMSKRLGLSADQTARLEPILAERQQKIEALRADTSLSREQRHSQMQAIAEGTRGELTGVLTPAQMDQLKSMRKEHRHGQTSAPAGA